MMMHAMGSAKGVALMLISLGVGYLVCVKADGQKGFLKQLGYWIGSIIIVVSILVSLRGICLNVYGKMGHKCPMLKARYMMPAR